MNEPIDIGTRSRAKIAAQYPTIAKIDIPDSYTVSIIDYKRDDIEKYDVIFWHRFLKKIYQEPTEYEYELLRDNNEYETKIEKIYVRKIQGEDSWEMKADAALAAEIEAEINGGKIKTHQVNWKYLIRLPSGTIVELGTIDMTTIFRIAHVILPGSSIKHSSDEDEKFIDVLLKEAKKENSFNPSKEFKKQEGIKRYLLFNIYLSNYLSAETMLNIADSHEADLRDEGLRYDARTSDILDKEKRKHIDKHILTVGMFYCSSIIYFYMALEGFVNLVLHTFLKNTFRGREFNVEKRLDLEQKIRLMPYMCKGFDANRDLSPTILSELNKLTEYRNILFHSKVVEPLKCPSFVEDGIWYHCDMEDEESVLPYYRFNLTNLDVVKVKNIVDDIVDDILKSMNQSTRQITKANILNEAHIPLAIMDTGELVIEGGKES